MFAAWLVACMIARASAQHGPGAGPWEKVKPESVGLTSKALDHANNFINTHVKNRNCFLLIKDGKIAYEWYDASTKNDPPLSPKWNGPADEKPHNGYSMTKTVGGFLLLMAASEGGLDLDVDITKHYGVPSPKGYGVTTRMVMAQVLGGDHRPGETWRYDNLGTDWLWVFPRIVRAATGHNSSYFMHKMHSSLGLSKQFKFPTVDTDWFSGATGSCRDWARFGQLILNGGKWDGHELIATKYIQQMQEPMKVAPYKEYSNPCYGLLIWLNKDKKKYPGCCWEASRLPEPHCNHETFMDGAVTDLTMNIGLYGQVVMTLPSVNTVVVGFGNDLRPIEPVQIGYYPGVCKALGIPCNTPPPVPKPKCGETLECTGVSAQCYSGGSWSHHEPKPGLQQCVQCFQNRLPAYQKRFPEAQFMVKDNCPKDIATAMEYIACFCGLTGKEANPFGPWRTTTTTTQAPGVFPPFSPAARTTPPPQAPGSPCDLTPKCIQGLQSHFQCFDMKRNGGHECYKGIYIHQKALTAQYGCPTFIDKSQPLIQSKAFCWCGHDPKPRAERLQAATWWDIAMLAENADGMLDAETFVSSSVQTDARVGKGGKGPRPSHTTTHSPTTSPHPSPTPPKPSPHPSPPHAPTTTTFPRGGKGGAGPTQRPAPSKPDPQPRVHNGCKNKHDYHQLKGIGGTKVKERMEECAHAKFEENKSWAQYPGKCMQQKLHVSPFCAYCFGQAMLCSHQSCLSECACGQTPKCKECTKTHCTGNFDHCSGDRRRRRHKMASGEFLSAEEDPFFEDMDEPDADTILTPNDGSEHEDESNGADDDESDDEGPENDGEDDSDDNESNEPLIENVDGGERSSSKLVFI